MTNLEIKQEIRDFNRTKNLGTYSRLLDINHKDRCKCKYCNNDIIYPQTKIRLSKSGEVYSVDGCYNTTKSILGNIFTLKVCWNCLSERFDIKNPSRCFNAMSEVTKFAFDIPDEYFKEARKKYAVTRELFIQKHGEERGSQLWDKYCKQQAKTNTFEYKQSKYGWTKEEFDEYNKSRAVTLKNMIKRYGEKIGKEKWDSYCEKQSLTKTWDYMVEHFGVEKAKDILLRRASHSNTGFSKISQKLFRELDEFITPQYTTQYATKGSEFKVQYDRWTFSLDYYIKELNVCVEFNGSIWHADPKLFSANDHPNPINTNLTSKDIWAHEKFREDILKTFGIRTYIIWEREYPGIDLKEFAEKIINENK